MINADTATVSITTNKERANDKSWWSTSTVLRPVRIAMREMVLAVRCWLV